jgi:transcription elongation factor GreB
VSKAFTDEETADAPAIVPPRAPLPAGVPNYVTARGLAQLRGELAELDAEAAAAERIADEKLRARTEAALAERRAALAARLASAELVAPPAGATDVVRFGATVTVEGGGGRRRWRLVGVDEADAGRAAIAFVSPLARALLGRRVGDTVRFRAPRGEEELEITAIDYGEDAPG